MRDSLDRYYTPMWVVDVMIAHIKKHWPKGLSVLEPCSGDGRIAHALCEAGYAVTTNDLDPEAQADTHDDFRQWQSLGHPATDAIVTNPPFRRVHEMVRMALKSSSHVAMLLPLTFLEPCRNRVDLLIDSPPSSVLILPRPSFNMNGKTDARTVAWFIWSQDASSFRVHHVHPDVRDNWRKLNGKDGQTADL